MIMKKTFKIMMVAVAAAFSLTASAENEGIILNQQDGTTVGFAFEQEPKLSFTATDVVIKAGETEVSYAMEGLKITFGETPTSVETIESADVKFRLGEDGIEAAGLQPGEAVTVYAIGGAVVQTAQVAGDGKVAISLPENGVYVVKAGKVSFKITK